METCSEIMYSHNFLDRVIFRVDFMQFIPSLQIFSPEVEETITKLFPVRGKKQIVHFNSLNIEILPLNNQANADNKFLEGYQIQYLSAHGNNSIILTNQSIVLEIKDYLSFDEHIKCFKSIIMAISAQEQFVAKRSGIRYINIYDTDKIRIQKNYFAPQMAAFLSSQTYDDCNNLQLIRSMNLSEYRIDANVLNFRYGLFNAKYPNIMQKKDFVLDYDCYTEEPKDCCNAIISFFGEAHSLIQSLFENSITDSMRMVMRND